MAHSWKVIAVAGAEGRAVDRGRVVQPRGDGLSQLSRSGVLECRSVEIRQAETQCLGDEVRIQCTHGGRGGDGTVVSTEFGAGRGSGVEPFPGYFSGSNARVQDLVFLVFDDLVQLRGEPWIGAEASKDFQEARFQR